LLIGRGYKKQKTRGGNSQSQEKSSREERISKNNPKIKFHSFQANFKPKKPNVKKYKSISVKKIVEKK
jgi:hypothetical protein